MKEERERKEKKEEEGNFFLSAQQGNKFSKGKKKKKYVECQILLCASLIATKAVVVIAVTVASQCVHDDCDTATASLRCCPTIWKVCETFDRRCKCDCGRCCGDDRGL